MLGPGPLKGGYASEIENALRELQKADILSKSTSISDNSLLQPLIIKICNNLYG